MLFTTSISAEPNPVVPNATVGEFRHGTHPSLGNYTHPGVDLVAPCGSDIFAFADGVVTDIISATNDHNFSTLGYMVIVKHPASLIGMEFYTLYIHMQEPPLVGIGQKVNGGETILGKIGDTGKSFGCHTHFEIRYFPSRYSAWGNIYGRGNQQNSAYFQNNWEDPVDFFNMYPNGIKSKETDKTRAEKIARIRMEADSTKALSDSLEKRVAVFENVLSGGGLFAPKSQKSSTAPPSSQNTRIVDQTLFKAELTNISHKGNSVFVQIRYTNKSDEEIEISYPRAILMDNSGNKDIDKKTGRYLMPPAPGTMHMAFEFDFVFYANQIRTEVDTIKTITPPFDLIVNAQPPHGSIMFQGIR
ncbi:peptidoglycan DD-metalloendopeptidase family protein [Prosthecochloris ethylica]|uniref:peptidoglycan DD-metalloendopeptidase family protein n=1 Tax=Prosthecochloris ethylica TaxID=2743976 RepID=UPI0018839CB4